jgi:hypothetical protein
MQDMAQMSMMSSPQQATMQPSDILKMFNSEREFLAIQSHEFVLNDVEKRLLDLNTVKKTIKAKKNE